MISWTLVQTQMTENEEPFVSFVNSADHSYHLFLSKGILTEAERVPFACNKRETLRPDQRYSENLTWRDIT
jgi:hypothetical protein